jgi:hypothetical protein
LLALEAAARKVLDMVVVPPLQRTEREHDLGRRQFWELLLGDIAAPTHESVASMDRLRASSKMRPSWWPNVAQPKGLERD